MPKKLMIAALAGLFTLPLAACGDDEPDTLEEALEETGDELEDAADEIGDDMEDAADDMEDAMDPEK